MVESALFSTQEVHWFMWVVISISLWKTSDNIRTRLLNGIDLYFSKKIHITDGRGIEKRIFRENERPRRHQKRKVWRIYS